MKSCWSKFLAFGPQFTYSSSDLSKGIIFMRHHDKWNILQFEIILQNSPYMVKNKEKKLTKMKRNFKEIQKLSPSKLVLKFLIWFYLASNKHIFTFFSNHILNVCYITFVWLQKPPIHQFLTPKLILQAMKKIQIFSFFSNSYKIYCNRAV